MTEQLYNDIVSHRPYLMKVARKLTRSEQAAEDLVQDCLARAMTKCHMFQPGTNLGAWLTTMMKRLHLNTIERSGRIVYVPPEEISLTRQADQEIQVELSQVRRAFRDLTPDQRRVMELVVLNGRRYEEAADDLQVSVGTIRSRLSRARSALSRSLAA